MKPLNSKLLRDLWRIKGQALAIMLVIALGVMVMVMMTSLVNTLEQTRDAYYARYRFADVFVDLVRAPNALAERVWELEGVARAETRVSGGALIDLPQFATPVYGQMISLPDFSEPALNRLYLSAGRLPAPHSGDEVVLLKGFADAWHMLPGDSLPVTIRGKRRTLHVVGLALAPEYVYTTPPGELAPDDGRFAVLWMREKALSQALELEGAFNQVLVRLTPGMQDEGVILALNSLFERFGGRGAFTGLDNPGAGQDSQGVVSGLGSQGSFYRALDAAGAPVYIRDEGLVLGQSLARVLGLAAGDWVRVELTTEARREVLLPVVRIADTLLGAPAYLSLKGMEAIMRDRQRVSGAFLRVDARQSDALYRRLKAMPAVAGVSVRAQTRAAFERMMNEGAGAVRYIMALIAAIISFGVVYNSARISFAEHVRELACLRVLGYSRGQAAYVLLGDMGLATLLALPLGAWGGFYLTKLIAVRFSTELYTIRAVVDPHSYGIAALAVLLAAGISAWVVRRDLDRTDLVIALKTWE